MMIWMLVLLPAVAGAVAFFLPWHGPRRTLLLAVALGHAGLTAAQWGGPAESPLPGWIALDEPALLFLTITSVLFLAAAVYAVGYLRREAASEERAQSAASPFLRQPPEATFTACLLMFLATMTLVLVSRHLGLIWVAVEATTLASAPLIYFHRQPRSLEATWKYLVICSVGIALALLGNFFLAVATSPATPHVRLTIEELTAGARGLDPAWLKAAFLLLLVGYGTKMGLAPLHTWLPDAHSEAPSMISALLSGALLNCALLAILRVHSVLVAAGLGTYSGDLLVVFGLFSMGVAAVFILGQSDYKRMLAYSSVEHMGVLALGAGLGGVAGFGAMLHAVNHSLTKAMLFFVAGNILAVYRTKAAQATGGLLQRLPLSGFLWMAGFLAISGSPPFGVFVSEITILKGVLDSGRYLLAAGYLAALVTVFVGMATIVLRMAYGPPAGAELSEAMHREPADSPRGEAWWSVAPPVALGLGVLILGLYVPPPLASLARAAFAALGGSST